MHFFYFREKLAAAAIVSTKYGSLHTNGMWVIPFESSFKENLIGTRDVYENLLFAVNIHNFAKPEDG